MVGGLLVAVAAVGTFAAVTGAGREPGTSVVVAARAVAPGTVLARADLATVALQVPGGLEGRVFTSPDAVVGAVAVGPLAPGELVQAGALATVEEAAVPTFALALPTAAANGGRLQPGDTVQVVATYGSDQSATTRLLTPEARVVGVDDGGDELGVTGQVQVLLAIASPEERSRVINAVTSGTITLVRTTGVTDPAGFPAVGPVDDGPEARGADG